MKLQHWVWLGSIGMAALAAQACGDDTSGSPAGTGGKASGGSQATGGGNTGGKASGGTSAGGTAAGGSAGAETGGGAGAETGGSAGAGTGGSAGAGTGGAGTGGAGTGGAGTGGGVNGGAAGMAGDGNQAGAAGAGPGSKAAAVVTPLGVGQTLAGTASFQLLGNDNVKLKLDVAGCPEGEHNVHIHSGNMCSAAGGHWIPNGEIIPAINCNNLMTGSLTLTAPAESWEVKTNTDNDVAKYVIVIHATTASGGAPIACGEINSL